LVERERPPDWSPVPPRGGGRGARLRAIVLRAVGAVAIAGFLWWRDHERAAVVLLALAATLTVAASLSPAVSAAAERVEAVIRRYAGRFLSLVFLTAVYLLVFLPLSLLLRLFAVNPLQMGRSADDQSAWRPAQKHPRRPLFKRPFAYDRIPHTAASRGLRLRAALGLIVIIIALDLALGEALNRIQGDPAPQSPTALTGTSPPAGRQEPWGKTVVPEVIAALNQKSYDPYLSFRVREFDGRYVNVTDGVRRSHQSRLALSRDAVTVWFFGGSSMFGAFQRDDHTIPSEFARLAEADGIPVRVTNYGQPAYVNWQDDLLMESLVTSKTKPDVAVFYDGFNELLAQFALEPHTEPSHLQARIMEERVTSGAGIEDKSFFKRAWKTWSETSALDRLGRSVGIMPELEQDQGPLLSTFVGDQADDPEGRGRNAASIYLRGVDRAYRLARSYGFDAAFFWQPTIYTRHLVKEEEPLASAAGYDADAWRSATRVARSRLTAPVVDLSRVLDGLREPTMYDVVHTNEKGARLVAAALYERVRPDLLRAMKH
jgi:hypothetical protein